MTPLFDLAPKESPRAMFGRDAELAQLVHLIDEGRWVAVLGARMVGKTSLIRAAAQRLRRPTVYVNLWGARGPSGFLNAFLHGLNASGSLRGRLRTALGRVDGVSLGPGGISVSAPPQPMRTVWDLLDAIGAQGRRAVIELDEVQEVASSSGTLLKLLGNVFHTHRDVVFVFSGSRFGLVRTLLEPRASSPLFGRPPATIRLEPFDTARSVEFLEAGFREYRRRFPRPDLEAVVARSLDGLPGWLALYGNHVAVEGLDPAEAEARTLREGAQVAGEELEHFLEGRSVQLHRAALRGLTEPRTWGELRAHLDEAMGGPVNDNTVRNVLAAAQDAGLVRPAPGDRYVVGDPMLRRTLASLRGLRPRSPQRPSGRP